MPRSYTPGTTPMGALDRGYFVRLPDMNPDEGGEGKRAANAYLERIVNGQKERVWLWINDITSNFALSGSTAQSKRRRSFFPHNLVQPSMAVGGQTPNSYQYQRIGEFVRDFHLDTITTDNTLRLAIAAGGPTNNRTIKGRRDGILVDGYIDHVGRGAERWVNAPDYQFNFIVTRALKLLTLEDHYVDRLVYNDIFRILTFDRYGYRFEEGGEYDPHDGSTSPSDPSPGRPDSPPELGPPNPATDPFGPVETPTGPFGVTPGPFG